MLKFIDGFDQYQAQTGSQLLGSLTAAGYTVSQGLAMTAGRHDATYALEFQVSAGTAGASWSKRTNGTKQHLRSVATNNLGRWIAVGESGAATMSTDTINWVPMIVGVANWLQGIEYAAGTWVIVGHNSTILVSTNDGGTWTKKTCPLPNVSLNAVNYASGRWTAVGGESNGVIIYSTDNGNTWSFVASNAGVAGNSCIAYGNGVWLVGSKTVSQLLRSTDGVNWEPMTDYYPYGINCLAYGEGIWLWGYGRNLLQSLDDGVTWVVSTTSIGSTNSTINTIEFIAGLWIVGGNGAFIATSDDTLTWTTRVLTGASITPVNAIAGSSGVDGALVAVGNLVSGSNPLQALIYASLAPPTTLQRTFNSTANKVVFGFAHRASARGRIMSIAGVLDMDWPGAIEILDTTSVAVPIRNAWYYYELVIDKVAKTVSLFVNDTADIIVTLPAAALTVVDYVVTWQAENGAVARLDDMYFLDNATTGGAVLVNRLRPIRIPLRLPTDDDNLEWQGSAEVPHWSLIGVLPPNLANYIYSGEPGAEDLFKSSMPLPVGSGALLAVGLVALAKKSDLDNRQLGLVVGSGANQVEIIDTALSINSEYSFAIFEKAPGNVAWDATNLLSTPFGVVVRP